MTTFKQDIAELFALCRDQRSDLNRALRGEVSLALPPREDEVYAPTAMRALHTMLNVKPKADPDRAWTDSCERMGGCDEPE